VYQVVVRAAGLEIELDGQSGTETWLSPDGAIVPRFWGEEQSMFEITCPGPSLRATVSIRQPIVGGVRQEASSAVEIDAECTPYVGESVQWRHATSTDLSRPQTLTGKGFAVTVKRRPN
jgi:hypothetical protein